MRGTKIGNNTAVMETPGIWEICVITGGTDGWGTGVGDTARTGR